MKKIKKKEKSVDKTKKMWYNISRRQRRREVGSIAQLGEHLPYKQGVIGSSPIVPTNVAR